MALVFNTQPMHGALTAPDINSSDYGFAQSYRQQLDMNRRQYEDVMTNYSQVLEAQRERAAGISARYDALGQQVMGYLEGAENPERERIQRQYDALAGQTQQSAVDRGLGNFTISDSLLRGVESDRSLASTDLAAKFGMLRADKAAQMGLAGLGYQVQAGMEQDAMAQAGMNFAGGYQWAMPDPIGYAQLAQQRQQFQSQQAQQQQQFQTQQRGNDLAQQAQLNLGYAQVNRGTNRSTTVKW